MDEKNWLYQTESKSKLKNILSINLIIIFSQYNDMQGDLPNLPKKYPTRYPGFYNKEYSNYILVVTPYGDSAFFIKKYH